jgi:periplasmic protein CpxP/Spy
MTRLRIAMCLSAVALLVGTLAPPLAAAPQRHGRRGGAFGRIPMRQLGLTDAQRQQLKGVVQSHRDEMASLRQRLQAARSALRQATSAVPLDEALVKQRRADLSAARADGTALRGRVRSEVLQVLTPDQQAQLKSLQDGARRRRRPK